jgi:ATP adenylyltransferase
MTGMSNPSLDPEDKGKHLDLIQGVVTRMSAASSSAKSWLLPVVTAAYGFALTNSSGSVASLGIVSVLLFSYIDANYLREERAYRKLYDVVALGEKHVPQFTLNTAHANEPLPNTDATATKQEARGVLERWLPGWHIWVSWSIVPFYGTLLLLGICVLVYAVVK